MFLELHYRPCPPFAFSGRVDPELRVRLPDKLVARLLQFHVVRVPKGEGGIDGDLWPVKVLALLVLLPRGNHFQRMSHLGLEQHRGNGMGARVGPPVALGPELAVSVGKVFLARRLWGQARVQRAARAEVHLLVQLVVVPQVVPQGSPHPAHLVRHARIPLQVPVRVLRPVQRVVVLHESYPVLEDRSVRQVGGELVVVSQASGQVALQASVSDVGQHAVPVRGQGLEVVPCGIGVIVAVGRRQSKLRQVQRLLQLSLLEGSQVERSVVALCKGEVGSRGNLEPSLV